MKQIYFIIIVGAFCSSKSNRKIKKLRNLWLYIYHNAIATSSYSIFASLPCELPSCRIPSFYSSCSTNRRGLASSSEAQTLPQQYATWNDVKCDKLFKMSSHFQLWRQAAWHFDDVFCFGVDEFHELLRAFNRFLVTRRRRLPDGRVDFFIALRQLFVERRRVLLKRHDNGGQIVPAALLFCTIKMLAVKITSVNYYFVQASFHHAIANFLYRLVPHRFHQVRDVFGEVSRRENVPNAVAR